MYSLKHSLHVNIDFYRYSEGGADFTINSQDFRSKRSNVADQFEFSSVGQLCFMVMIEVDMLLEFEESFSIQLDAPNFLPSGVTLGSPEMTTITILDDQGEQSRYS